MHLNRPLSAWMMACQFFLRRAIMFRRNFLLVFVITILLLTEGCSVSKKDHLPSNSVNTPQDIPFLIFLMNTEAQNQVNSDNCYVCRFSLESGKILIEDLPLFKRTIQDHYDFRMIWNGEKKILINSASFGGSVKLDSLNPNYEIEELRPAVSVGEVIKNTAERLVKVYNKENQVIVEFGDGKMHKLNPPLPPNSNQIQTLLISGDEHNYRLLITYDIPSSEKKNVMSGKLLIATVNEGNIKWNEVRGEYCSFIAGAGSSVAQIDDEIYITTCGGNVSVVSLQKDAPVLEEYKPINKTLLSLSDKFQDVPIQPHFGVYKKCLIVTVQNLNEKWLWFLRDGVYLGGVHIDTTNNKIETNLAGNQIETMVLPSKAAIDLPILTLEGYGAWK